LKGEELQNKNLLEDILGNLESIEEEKLAHELSKRKRSEGILKKWSKKYFQALKDEF